MAHEALKFNVNVNDTKNWQPIVGNTDYGTFYMVYIKFAKMEEVDNKYHYYAEFKLQNYDGNISIGFEGNPRLSELNEQEKLERENEIKDLIDGFHSKPIKEQQEILEMHHVDFILEIDVMPFDTDYCINRLKLKSTTKILNGNVLETNCIRKTPNINMYKQTDPLNSKYINPYHYKRAGDEILEIGTRNRNSKEPFNYVGNSGTLLSRCNPSRSFLI